MVYVNKPKPSKGFVSYFILVFLVFPAPYFMFWYFLFMFTNTFIMFLNTITPNLPLDTMLVPLSIYYIIWIPFTGINIHGAYNTEYRIEDGKLWMKFGYLRKGSVPLDEIRGIEKDISGNWRLIFHIRPYCNRFKNGVGIITEDRTIWVSPEDSEKFVSKLGLKTGR